MGGLCGACRVVHGWHRTSPLRCGDTCSTTTAHLQKGTLWAPHICAYRVFSVVYVDVSSEHFCVLKSLVVRVMGVVSIVRAEYQEEEEEHEEDKEQEYDKEYY